MSGKEDLEKSPTKYGITKTTKGFGGFLRWVNNVAFKPGPLEITNMSDKMGFREVRRKNTEVIAIRALRETIAVAGVLLLLAAETKGNGLVKIGEFLADSPIHVIALGYLGWTTVDLLISAWKGIWANKQLTQRNK